MRTFPGIRLEVFKNFEEREQIKVLADYLRQVNQAFTNSIEPGQTPGATTNTDSLDNYLYLPGRSGGQTARLGTASSDSGTIADNAGSAAGNASTGYLNLTAGTVRVRHGSTSNTGNIFEVTNAAGSTQYFYILDSGNATFGSADTTAKVSIPWQNGANSSLSIGTPGNSETLDIWPTSTEVSLRHGGGTGGFVIRASSVLNNVNLRVSGLTTLQNMTGITNVPLTIRGVSGQTGHLQDWTDSGSNVLSSILADGSFSGPVTPTSLSPTDSVFRIVDNGDATKKIAWEVSGVAASTTRTHTVPNVSGTSVLAGNLAAPPAAGEMGKYDNATWALTSLATTNLVTTGPPGMYRVCVYMYLTGGPGAVGEAGWVRIGWDSLSIATTLAYIDVYDSDPGLSEGYSWGERVVYTSTGTIYFTLFGTGITGAGRVNLRIRAYYLG